MNTAERLIRQAQMNHGIMLQPAQVRELAGTIINMDKAIQEQNIVMEAYVSEYGDGILEGLLHGNNYTADESGDEQPTLFAEDAVLAEVVYEDEEGQAESGPGVHPQVAEGQGASVEVSEVPELGDDSEREAARYDVPR